jgi:hypothetical protein
VVSIGSRLMTRRWIRWRAEGAQLRLFGPRPRRRDFLLRWRESANKPDHPLYRTAVPILIAVISAASSTAIGLAAKDAQVAAERRQEHLRDVARLQTREIEIAVSVAENEEIFARYKQHIEACQGLVDQSRGQLGLRDQLDVEAQQELALARSVRTHFMQLQDVGWGRCASGDGPTYKAGVLGLYEAEARQQAYKSKPDFQRLEHAESVTKARAELARDKTEKEVRISALLLLAVFLLTVGRLRRPSLRLFFLPIGLTTAVVGIALLAVEGLP